MSGVDRCGRCGTPLERPGDFCLTCRRPNADAVVVAVAPERAVLTVLDGETVVGETVVPTEPEPGGRLASVQRRNYVGRIVDEVRRKRPEAVYLAGERALLREVGAEVAADCYRVDPDDPVAAAIARGGERALEVVDRPAAEKLRGSHSTIVGGRTGREAVLVVAGHPHVKAVIPGPISAGGRSSRGATAKATRAGDDGNVRLLLRDGSSVQENRVVTTARTRETGERVRADLNERLAGAGLA